MMKRLGSILLLTILFGGAFFAAFLSPQSNAIAQQTIPKAAAQSYLPVIVKPAEPPLAKLGVDFGNLIVGRAVISSDMLLAKQMGADWQRVELPWMHIEGTPGVFDWRIYDEVISRTVELDVKVLVHIHSPPTWAAVESCGAISNTVALTNFATLAVTRYQAAVDAWEFINEPDGKVPQPKFGPTVGCWAPDADKYAAQLRLFYSTVKPLDPSALVLFGSLAYDNWEFFDRKFLENVLAQGVDDSFDVLGLHYYPINLPEFPSMRDKIKEIRAILDKHLLWNKLIWVTETAMWANGVGGLEDQRDFVVREQSRGFCSGADNLFWFGIRQEGANPPLHRWLISIDHRADQAYNTFRHFSQRVTGRACQPLAALPAGVEGYSFADKTRPDLYVIWSNGKSTKLTLPTPNGVSVFNRDGTMQTDIPAQGGSVTISVDPQPIFVVMQ